MSANGYLKGQITKAANALRAKISSVEQELDGSAPDAKVCGDTILLQKKFKLQEAVMSLKYLMKSLKDNWKRAENHAATKTDSDEQYTLLQEFTDHWDANGSDELLIRGELSVSLLETIISTLSTSQEKETEHAEHSKAKDLIASVRLSPENYQEAIDLLLSTYNRPQVLRNRLVEELEMLPPADSTPTDQRSTLCKIKAIWVQLKNLKEQPGSTTTMRIIRSKFPQKTREKVGEMRQKNDEWTAEELILAFDQVIDRLEIMEDNDPLLSASQSSTINNVWAGSHSSKNAKIREHTKGRRVSPYRPLHSTGSSHKSRELSRCAFCVRTGHSAYDCNEVLSPYARRKMTAELNLCWKCLKSGHRSSQCNAQPCLKCGRAHNSALCYVNSRSRSSSRSNSPRQRQPYRRSSTDSYSSSSGFRNRSRTVSRSPSPNYREKAFQRNNKTNRKGSPHPKVGFKNLPTSHIYSTPSYTTHEDTQEVEYTANHSDLQEDDHSEDDLFLVNAVQTMKASSHMSSDHNIPQLAACKVASLANPPRLMIIKASTRNYNNDSDQLVTVLLDSGSQHSYIKRNVAQDLGLQFTCPQEITTMTFGGHAQTETSYRVNVVLQNIRNGNSTPLHLWTRNFITTVSTDGDEEKRRKHFRSKVEVDILIGMDYYWDLVDFKFNRRLPSGLVECRTKLGPVLSGYSPSPSSTVHSALGRPKDEQDSNRETEKIVQHLFGLEMAGMKEDNEDADNEVIKRYRDTGMNGFSKDIPRFIGKSKEAKYELIVFSDASQRVYAAVTYLVCRQNGENPVSNIIFSKTKLTIPKKATIPRLELLALVLAVKSIRFLLKELKIPISSIQILSDSQIALYWIQSKKPLKTFVHNRVSYIRKVLDEFEESKIPSHLHYVNSEHNPADAATRGLTASELVQHMWWHGPRFVTRPCNEWPEANSVQDFHSPLPEEAEKEFKLVHTVTTEGYESFIPFNRTNSYTKLVRITAHVLKYTRILKSRAASERKTSPSINRNANTANKIVAITSDDMRDAELLILREHYREGALQLHSRILNRLRVTQDENGIYRCNVRMGNAQLDSSAKNPILLLSNHRLSRMIVEHFHQKLFHAGSSHLVSALRNHYFIPKIRRLVNSLALKKAVHTKSMTLWHLQTLISEIEATLNTRPITPVITNSNDEPLALRPIDLICPQFTLANVTDSNSVNHAINRLNISDSHAHLISHYTILRDMLDQFWNSWHRDYLHALAEKAQYKAVPRQGSKSRPKVGDVVLIKQENINRSAWPLAIITQLHSSSDGSVRSVTLKTGANKTLERSINQLVPLEVNAENGRELQNNSTTPLRLQPPRAAKTRILH
ncbi:zinc knuckle [Ostertagia ostertagi]